MISDGVRVRSIRNIILSATVCSAIMVALTVLPSSAAAATEKACYINIAGYVGYYICGTERAEARFPSGTEFPSGTMTFVIGMDHAVWRIWRGRNGGGSYGWRSLGGWAKYGVSIQYVYDYNHYRISTYGSDDRLWCKSYYGGSWYRWTTVRCPFL